MTNPTPTLTDLRETAWMIVDCDIADNRIALARAFLSLTDPIMCYQRQLATVTAERDELRSRFRPLPNLQRQSTPTNCFRACVAMVLGLPIGDVPEACDGASWDWDEFQRWMSGRGMQAIEVAFENGGTLYPVSSPVPCIVTGQSPRESTTGRHAVVGRFIGLAGFELVGDPHPSDLWIDGEPTHAVFFVPLWPTVISERDDLRRELEELRDRMQDAAMEAREEQCST